MKKQYVFQKTIFLSLLSTKKYDNMEKLILDAFEPAVSQSQMFSPRFKEKKIKKKCLGCESLSMYEKAEI